MVLIRIFVKLTSLFQTHHAKFPGVRSSFIGLGECNHGEFVFVDPFKDANWSSVVGMKEGYRLFAIETDVGLTEIVAVTHADGTYIAGEKVATVREVESIPNELQNTRAELQDMRVELSRALSSLASLKSLSSHPPVCMDPGGDKIQLNGAH
ncbi:hypothetical protein CYMTET_12315 [Cymbomonas tetramitiformis]|uniref:Uncharacterized protein n=1 Tax=Cymbomonas tetramitiformis TaxID=36881 RepID=A0AAE0GKN5_9CHLO|nr:hypothetical protein CYMTET_12315 [Cymbomonas tetramitiformis]